MFTKVVSILLFVQLTVVLAIKQVDGKTNRHPTPKNKPTFSWNLYHQVHATGHSLDWNEGVLLDKRKHSKDGGQYHKNKEQDLLIPLSSNLYNCLDGSFLKQVKSKDIDQWKNKGLLPKDVKLEKLNKI